MRSLKQALLESDEIGDELSVHDTQNSMPKDMSKAMSGDKIRVNSHSQKRMTLMQMYMQNHEIDD